MEVKESAVNDWGKNAKKKDIKLVSTVFKIQVLPS